MTSFWRPITRLTILCVVAATLASGSTTWAVVTLIANPDYPDFPDVFTADPYADSSAARGITADRNLRQTFKNSETFDVSEIVLSFKVNSPDGGMILEFYEVDDVSASTWAAGNLVHTISLPSLIGTSTTLGITLSESDIFELPARFEGTTGYGLEISNFDNTTTIGEWRHTHTGEDAFLDGVFYTEGGGPSGSGDRDVGLSLLSADAMPAQPGDVNGDGVVDTNDLDIIALNFRQGSALRPDGDLTGDGVVNLQDFRVWKFNFPGAVTPAMLAGLTVPEPASLAGVLLALAGIGSVRVRRSRV